MSAELIEVDFRARAVVSRHVSTEPSPITAEQALAEVRALLEHAYGIIRSERAGRDLAVAEGLLEGLGHALQGWEEGTCRG